MAKAISGIYIIVNTKTGKVYVGQSANIQNRFKQHKWALRSGRHYNSHFQAAWNKYGEGKFRFEIAEHCRVDDLDEREQSYLDIYFANGNCYNLAKDATYPARGLTQSVETRKKRSESLKGIIRSEETRKKISDAKKNPSTETRAKMSIAAHNRPPQSSEVRGRKSDKLKGRVFSEETRKKISDAKKNPSEATRRKLREAATGKRHSDETRRKLSEAAKLNYQKSKEQPLPDEADE